MKLISVCALSLALGVGVLASRCPEVSRVCADDFSLSVCSNGIWKAVPCGTGEKCTVIDRNNIQCLAIQPVDSSKVLMRPDNAVTHDYTGPISLGNDGDDVAEMLLDEGNEINVLPIPRPKPYFSQGSKECHGKEENPKAEGGSGGGCGHKGHGGSGGCCGHKDPADSGGGCGHKGPGARCNQRKDGGVSIKVVANIQK